MNEILSYEINIVYCTKLLDYLLLKSASQNFKLKIGKCLIISGKSFPLSDRNKEMLK